MKIVSTSFEPSGSQACVEVVFRVTLDGKASECEVTGSVSGPHARGRTTVAVAYSMVLLEKKDDSVLLKCVIPEPSFWSKENPLSYGWSIDVEVNGKVTDSSSGALAFPAPK
jgi:hypothetical protein